MLKTEIENKGIPMYVDDVKDLPGKKDSTFDSYFVSCEFEAEDGNRYGIVWHQQTQFGKFMTVQVLLTDPANALCDNTAVAVPADDKTYISLDKMECVSSLGSLIGTKEEMYLKLNVKGTIVDLTLRPRDMTLCNGTTGLLKFLGGMDNYQFSFPNMDVEGTFTLNGKTHKVQNTTAWFDRQWGFSDASHALLEGTGMNRLSWLWIGFPINEARTEAVSLWDSYASDGRYCFATIYNEDGTQINHKTEITYKDVWKSKQSNCSYPGSVHVEIPTADIKLDLTILPGDPEFYHPENGLSGFEALCKVNGTYKNKKIDRYGFLEIIGDVCGEV
ncbi:lipocalin-like domain-containing protein [Paenibacillus kribbensis]|uniref:lipocalin-like domain-containing protein n=1 Tax=Paenibacillus kribbensis TaxID=172713 RepID=UPI002DC0053E|nr:lipocalin-like domain-containing protein [Paenibacillus kribbensis]MEC0232802.1 lipocalin-like domain-containing protein [Paenibacillus kribbensis]